MNIAQGLKQKNRLEKALSELIAKITKYQRISALEVVAPPNIGVLIEEYHTKATELADLKKKICTASVPVTDKICRQDSIRKLLKTIRELNTSTEPEEHGYGEHTRTKNFKVQLDYIRKDDMVSRLIAEVDSIQDDLDNFNAITKLS